MVRNVILNKSILSNHVYYDECNPLQTQVEKDISIKAIVFPNM